jgi:hypothetical protein
MEAAIDKAVARFWAQLPRRPPVELDVRPSARHTRASMAMKTEDQSSWSLSSVSVRPRYAAARPSNAPRRTPSIVFLVGAAWPSS